MVVEVLDSTGDIEHHTHLVNGQGGLEKVSRSDGQTILRTAGTGEARM